jgi:hypothetical protein
VNRKTYISIFASALVCLTFGLLTGCSSSSSTPPPNNNQTPTIAISVSSGSGQSAQVSTAFAQPLVATVTSNGTAASGVTVTFSAPTSGASCALSATTATTNSSGNAQVTCTANSTAGAYAVTATASGATSPASFGLTNTTAVVSSNTYVFYASGEDSFGGFVNYYAIAGAVTIDLTSGNVTGGELDYNDGEGLTSGSGTNTPDSITGGTLTADATTGVGTLTLTTSNSSLGGVNTAAGTVEFAIQFVNSNHALIAQFDGSATSSGSFDLQNLGLGTSGQSSFAISGVDSSYNSVGFGGIFSPTSATSANVTLDANDDGTASQNNPYTATLGTPDSFGRTLITGISNPAAATPYAMTFAAYPVTQEAIRIIDIDFSATPPYDTAVGSAYGQGSAAGTFSNASLTADVFTLLGQWSYQYAAVGEFTTDTNGNITAGTADDNESLETDAPAITGASLTTVASTYNITGTGYSTMTIGAGDLGDISPLGVYMVDPTLNINDPNNTATDLGGALVLDLTLPGGIGVITPQTDTTQGDFGGSYAAGFQDLNDFQPSVCAFCEFDMVGPFTMTATTGPLATATIGAEDSDPFGTWDGTPGESHGDSFSSTPTLVSTGYYSGSPLNATINTAIGSMGMDLYQASATTLYWIETDETGVFLGPIEGQGSLSNMPAAKRSLKLEAKQGPKPANQHGGPVR